MLTIARTQRDRSSIVQDSTCSLLGSLPYRFGSKETVEICTTWDLRTVLLGMYLWAGWNRHLRWYFRSMYVASASAVDAYFFWILWLAVMLERRNYTRAKLLRCQMKGAPIHEIFNLLGSQWCLFHCFLVILLPSVLLGGPLIVANFRGVFNIHLIVDELLLVHT